MIVSSRVWCDRSGVSGDRAGWYPMMACRVIVALAFLSMASWLSLLVLSMGVVAGSIWEVGGLISGVLGFLSMASWSSLLALSMGVVAGSIRHAGGLISGLGSWGLERGPKFGLLLSVRVSGLVSVGFKPGDLGAKLKSPRGG